MARKTRKRARSGKRKGRLEKPDPFDLLVKSLKDFRSNLMLLVPGLLSFVLFMVLGVFVLFQYVFAALYGFDELLVLIFFFLDLIIALVITVYFQGAELGVMADVVAGKKTSFRRMLRLGKTLFAKTAGVFIASMIILSVPAVIMGLIFLALAVISQVAAAAIGVMSFFLYVILLIAFLVITIFSFPILIDRKFSGFFSGFRIMLESFNYAKANPGHVAITVAFVFCLWLIIQSVSWIFAIPLYLANYELLILSQGSESLALLVSAISFLLETLIPLIAGVFVTLFIFNSYFSRNRFNWKQER